MGIRNAVVTNHAPNDLVKHFPTFFDKVVVDAPCSGEGMFRKEEQALTMWSQDNVDLCAERQKEILESAAEMLKPDGYLTYSTCTFAPDENEGVILHFLRNHPEFEVVDPKNQAVLDCIKKGLIDRGNPTWVDGGDEYAEQIKKTLRIFPHKADGEGHFAALLHKSADAPTVITKDRKNDKKKQKERGGRSQTTPDSAYKLFLQFIKDVTDEELDGVPCLFGEQLYLCPTELPSPPDGLKTLRHGLHLGTVVNGNRFEPSHALAMAIDPTKTKKAFNIDLDSAFSYLRGEVIPCGNEKGWHIVTHDSFPLGWGKASDGMMKNHYPKGLRK
jgi:NOL1/NOP2/fmu family ribosome biogenesis protein